MAILKWIPILLIFLPVTSWSQNMAEVIVIALRENPSLEALRAQVSMARQEEASLRANFDPALFGKLAFSDEQLPRSNQTFGTGVETFEWQLGLRKRFPIGLSADLSINRKRSQTLFGGGNFFSIPNNLYETQVALSISQPLLRDAIARPDKMLLAGARGRAWAASARLRYQAELVAQNTAVAYLDFNAGQSELSLSREMLKEAEIHLKAQKKRMALGRYQRETELPAAAAAESRSRMIVLMAEMNAERARLDLTQAVGRPVSLEENQNQIIEIELDAPNLKKAMDLALVLRGDHSAARHTRDAARAAKKLARQSKWPDLRLEMAAIAGGQGTSWRDDWEDLTSGDHRLVTAALALDLPLFGGIQKENFLEKEWALKKAEADLKQIANTIRVDVQRALLGLEQARQHRELAEKLLASEEERVRADLRELEIGRGDSQFLVMSRTDRNRARIDLLRSKSDGHKAKIMFLRATGQLIESLGLAKTMVNIE